jgi:hypothetical protein
MKILKNIKDSITILSKYRQRSFWSKPNIVEFICFMNKLLIIIPGLLFGYQWWWLYVFALASSLGLIWSGTIKLQPTIVLFNYVWAILAICAIVKHFLCN